MRWILLFILYLTLLNQNRAQHASVLAKQFLIQTTADYSEKQLIIDLKTIWPSLNWTSKRLIPEMSLWKIKYTGQSNDAEILERLKHSKNILIAQYNHKITLRTPQSTTPDDPLFANQWQYINTFSNPGTAGVDLDADLAWDITTGGLSAQDDTIVIAVLDNGISLTHDDFGDNLWRNHAEIPNNNIDDDQNGYIDDYLGWNSTTDNDLIAGGSHGTSVAGIIGAKGNNNKGVSGINWNIKLMIIRNDFNVDEAKVLSAYGYALTQRKLYNKTQGQEGAFVVATNASWGLDFGQPSAAPLWCAFYDTLGVYGILNVGATANSNTDVDILGDLPTTCPSDYMVAVTNVNNLGYKVPAAAYGSNNIDLGAFGAGVYTTISPTGYGNFGGTSGAAPHVSGTIGLLYAAACSNFISFAQIHPDSAALKMKDYLMNGVVPIVDLNGTTVSGGYLNTYNSISECINDCPGSCYGPYQFETIALSDTSASIRWDFTTGIQQVKYRIKAEGGSWSNFSTLALNQNNLSLTSLNKCTNYIIECVPFCQNGQDTSRFLFQTKGCCEAPSGLAATPVSFDSIRLDWTPLIAATEYLISYKKPSDNSWSTASSWTNNSGYLIGLDSCAYYQIRLQAVCASGDTTAFADSILSTTLGCTSCGVLNYCSSMGSNSNDDWIDTFSVDATVYASGNNGGYILQDSVAILLGKGDYHLLSITQGRSFVEFVEIWLDINQDGDFDDPDENIFSDIMATTQKTLNSSFIVPASALLGVTRMRVSMQYNSRPEACSMFTYGEVEDYCVQIIEGNSTTAIGASAEMLQVYPNPFQQVLNLEWNLAEASPVSLKIWSVDGRLNWHKEYELLPAGQHFSSIKAALPAGIYLLEARSKQGIQLLKIVRNP